MQRFIRLISIVGILTGYSMLSAQTDINFKQQLKENKFTSIKTTKVPVAILKYFGYVSYEEVGGKTSSCGCTGPRLRINWVVTDNAGIWVMKTQRCGAWTETHYSVIINNSKVDIPIKGELKTFTEFKNAYLSDTNH